MPRALFIGRFQPFHLGHLSVLQDIDSEQDVSEIIIGVGSSQYNGTEKNPYTFEQRKKMTELSVENKLKKRYNIVPVPDIHNDDEWVNHVIGIVGKVDIVYTGNALVKKLFKKAGFVVRPVEFKIKITGTEIREMMEKKDNGWRKFVSKNVEKILEY